MVIYDPKKQSFLKTLEWASEDDLDLFLFENPEALSQALYPEEGANCLVPLGRQLESIDLLYLRLPTNDNLQTGLLLCEDKLGSNPELRRKVFGQVIDYAARIYGMDEGTFEEELKECVTKPDVKAIHNRCVKSGTLRQEDVNACISSAVAAKRKNEIECAICAENIPDTLLQMVCWFNMLCQGRLETQDEIQKHIKACTVKQLQDRDITVVAVASALDMLTETEAQVFTADYTRGLLKKASDLMALPVFHTYLTEVRKTESAVIVESQLPASQVPSTGSSPASMEDWVKSVPTEIRTLYERLDGEIKLEKRWRLGRGQGAQLALDLLLSGRPIDVLRLKDYGMSFVSFKTLEAEGLDEISHWARKRISELGVKDSNIPQPSISAERIKDKPDLVSSVILFVNELGDKVTKALKPK